MIKKLFHALSCIMLLTSCIFLLAGCDNDSNPVRPWKGSPYADRVISAEIGCEGINLYTNPEEALGPPNWGYLPDGRYSGFVSLGPGGRIILEMGVDVIDGPGPDIKVYQAVSNEEIAVYVAENFASPFLLIGGMPCGGSCNFDLNNSGYSKVRYLMVEDRTFSDCYETAGADIDAVEALNYR